LNGIIKTNENISDIALTYFDEQEEVLKEITADNLYFSLSPFSTSYKRLYLVGDLIYNDIIRVRASPMEGYTVKLKILDRFNYVSDFEDATDQVYCSLDNKHLNSIPLDILIISENIVSETVPLVLTIIVGEEPS